jgi:hypothetical protein
MTALPRTWEYPSAPHVTADAHAAKPLQVASFTHTVQTKANSIRFTHLSLCSPAIPTLLKALKRGYLKGCPNLSALGVTKYLNPSPATAKGHMKRPRHGIRSTRRIVTGFVPEKNFVPGTPCGFPLESDGSDASSASAANIVPLTGGPVNVIEHNDDFVVCFCSLCRQKYGDNLLRPHR